MVVETIITTTINEVDYEVEHCNPKRGDEHFQASAVRKDKVATSNGQGGIIIARVRAADLSTAMAVHSALTTVALLNHTRPAVS